MTVSTTTASVSYNGDGTTTVLTVPFYFLQNADLLVQQTNNNVSPPVTRTLTLGTDYSVSGAGIESGGSITLSVAAGTGYVTLIDRNVAPTQTIHYVPNDAFPASTTEQSLDKLTMLCQQLLTALGYTITLPPNAQANYSNVLPYPQTGYYLAWGPTGLENLPATSTVSPGVVVDSSVSPSAAIQSSKLSYQYGATGSVARTVLSKLSDRICVMDFGAKGDGVTNDAPAILAASTAAALSNKALFFPAATYLIKTYMKLGNNVHWQGEKGTIIKFDPACTRGPDVIGSWARSMYTLNTTNFALDTIDFEGASTAATAQIDICLSQTSNIYINNCSFNNFGNTTYYDQGLAFNQCTDIVIDNCRFMYNSGDGAGVGYNCANFKVTNCTFGGNGDWGFVCTIGCTSGVIANNLFLTNTSTATGADRCSNISFVGNVMTNNQNGIRICRFGVDTNKMQYMSVVGNVINGTGQNAISIEECNAPGCIQVVGNTVFGSQQQGINVSDSSVVTITGNSVSNTVGSSILIASYTAGYETGRITIAGNTLENGTYGIQQITGPGTITNISVFSNRIDNMSISNYSYLANSADYMMTTANYFDMSKYLNLPSGGVANTATSGSNTLPANPHAFFPIWLGGTQYKVPFYNL
jgi:parallel beta-helix repeat protein